MEPDYSSYSTAELEEVLRHIDQAQFPERYQAVDQLLTQRRVPITQDYSGEIVIDTSPSTAVNEPATLGVFPYVIGALAFIPLLGVIFGIIALVWGLLTSRQGGKLLASIGVLAMLSANSYFFIVMHKVGLTWNTGTNSVQTQVLQNNLNTLYSQIELYHFRNGEYPQSLAQLQQAFPLSGVPLQDTSFKNSQSDFFYQRLDQEHYQLLARGTDGKPLTDDDIWPNTSHSINDVNGLMHRPAVAND